MPLLDHFHPPLSATRHWESFHAAWATGIMATLNRSVLPAGYFAETQVHIGSRVEVDVASFEDGNETDLLEQPETSRLGSPSSLYTVAYRPVRRDPAGDLIKTWPAPLSVGQPLPIMPLALRSALVVPLELESTYDEARQRSRL